MEIAIHRVNTIEKLRSIPSQYGAEIDLRAHGSQLYLHHDAFSQGDLFEDYLNEYQHGLLILNIKESGIEDEVLRLVRSKGLRNFFLLDVEFPYLFRAAQAGERAIAARYSETEPLEAVDPFKEMIDWVWVDTMTQLPFKKNLKDRWPQLKTCLVCPERWGRPNDIIPYRKQMRNLKISLDAVMTSLDYLSAWEQPLD